MKRAKDWRKKDYLLISISACFWTRLWLWGAVLNCSADSVLESPQSQPRIEWVIKQGLCPAQCSVLFLCSHWTPAGQPLASWVQCVVTGFTSQHSELMPWGATEHPFEVPNETLAAFISLLPSGHIQLPWPNLRPSNIQTLVFEPCVGKNYLSPFSLHPVLLPSWLLDRLICFLWGHMMLLKSLYSRRRMKMLLFSLMVALKENPLWSKDTHDPEFI